LRLSKPGLGLFEATDGGLFGIGKALGIDAEEDGDAVAGPFGDLGGGDGDVEQVDRRAWRRS
jgi:hypothetical protein